MLQVFSLHSCIRHLSCRIQCWSVLIVIHLSMSCSRLTSKDLCLCPKRKTPPVQTASKLLIACPFSSLWMWYSCTLEWCECQVCHIFTTDWYHSAIQAADEFWHSMIWLWWFYLFGTPPVTSIIDPFSFPSSTPNSEDNAKGLQMILGNNRCYQPAYNTYDSSFTLTDWVGDMTTWASALSWLSWAMSLAVTYEGGQGMY